MMRDPYKDLNWPLFFKVNFLNLVAVFILLGIGVGIWLV